MEALYQSIALSIPAANPGGRTLSWDFDKMDLSWAESLRFRLHISTIGADAGDTFNFYVQARRADGVWSDRVAFPQYLGTASDDEVYDMLLQAFGTLDSTEEGSEPQGSTGGSRLTANTVVNGSFPGKFYTGGAPSNAWRLQCVVVDADNDAFLTGTLYVYGNEAI